MANSDKIDIKKYIKSLPNKGNIAWEYNPLHNYQTDVDLFKVGNFLIPRNKAVNPKTGEILNKKGSNWVDKRGNIISEYIECDPLTLTLEYPKGSLLDLDTDLLNFDLNHPVDILVQPSYDGSVNLILNDDKNIPRLVNTRFSVREKNTYEIVDRIGENDTNIYNSSSFDKDTSLYFLYESNPIINYLGFVKGRLPVGLYCIYLTYCDADDNESDYVAESGLIPVFIGSDNTPESIDGGIKNQSSNKGIRLKIKNLDSSYNYLKVYYVRYFADVDLNRVLECKKLLKKFYLDYNTLYLQITGEEEVEDIDANELNISRFNPKSVLTSAQCKNMLFLGNIVKNTDNYKELTDISLRIVPSIKQDTIDLPDNNYTGEPGYYSSSNMYLKVGYFNLEYYRFGIVYIYNNGTLSNVYNTLGLTLNNTKAQYKKDNLYENTGEQDAVLYRKYIDIDNDGWILNGGDFFEDGQYLNSKGVCKLDLDSLNENDILGIQFNIPEEVKLYLKEELNIRGFFFVRQKCVPNILALCYLMPMDEVLEAPVIETYDSENKVWDYYTECFVTQNTGYVRNDYNSRLYKFLKKEGKSSISEYAYAAICPDFMLNQPYYNQIFNGSNFKLLRLTDKNDSQLVRDGRFYSPKDNITTKYSSTLNSVKICTVTDAVPTVAIKDKIYRLEIGKAEESFRFRYVEVDSGVYDAGTRVKNQYSKGYSISELIDKATNLVRGIYSPYLAIYSNSKLDTSCLYNIYQDVFDLTNLRLDFQVRMDSSEPFYAISDRYNFSQLSAENTLDCWRGDCYINNFTYRLNRNFSDPSLPNNDVIIDQNTWFNYTSSNPANWDNISRSDLNAVLMGSWITFKVRSSMNYALRSEDHSNVSEEALMGAPRSFYPRSGLMYRGENKMPDSYLYNDAYRASLGFKCYFALDNINYLKDTFSNRIQYSAIAILDSYKNNYRYSLSTYFRDYSSEYGGITKLVAFEGYLLVVFEHAVGVAVINEKVLQSSGEGEPVFINTGNILPEDLIIISDTIGTQWTESVVKSEAGFVYGVDTVAKKIWRVRGLQLDIISDFKVNSFLTKNITLSERELEPTIGLKNIKTHYNNNKKDVMFTFYDDVYKDEEKVWNLCYNEILDLFITFYSWVPSYSENIDTQFFTFNRNTSKCLSLLSKSNYAIPENNGILLDTPILSLNNSLTESIKLSNFAQLELGTIIDLLGIKCSANSPSSGEIKYRTSVKLNFETLSTSQTFENGVQLYIESTPNSNYSINVYKYDSTTLKYVHKSFGDISNKVSYELVKDHWKNYELFNTKGGEESPLLINGGTLSIKTDKTLDFIKALKTLKVILLYVKPRLDSISPDSEYNQIKTSQYFTTECIALTTEGIVSGENFLSEGFYIHGAAGIIDNREKRKPCFWYGEQHPFELEFVVNDNIGILKIFNNLLLISNKAEPESFHFEIEGDNYDFSKDKKNMYFRQEKVKEAYQNLGSNILFNRDCEELIPLIQNEKSTIFPLYYNRIDTFNDIYHKYQLLSQDGFDYLNLSGSETVYNEKLNQFDIITHIKNSPIDKVGRIRGNSYYKEGKWNILIPSLIYCLKNELQWIDNKPPLVLFNIPNDLTVEDLTTDLLPKYYTNLGLVEVDEWIYRKEAKIRDKWIKIRVRYDGTEPVIIHSIMTLYNYSYA